VIEIGIGRRYLRALFELARETQVEEQVLADLKRFQSLLDAEPDLRRYLADPRVGHHAKRKLLERTAPADLCDLCRDFLLFVAERGRAAILPQAAAEFEAMSLEARGIATAVVTSASELDDETRTRLQKELRTLTGREVRTEHQTDPALIAGLRVRIGSTLYDGSARRALEDLGEALRRVPLPAPADDAPGASGAAEGAP